MVVAENIGIYFEFRPVIAHLVNARFGDFYAGLFHVITAIEHLLPMIALGLFAGQQNPRGARFSIISFFSCLLIGAIIGVNLPEIALLNYLCIFSLIITGGVVIIQWKTTSYWIIIIAGFIGITQGLANGSSLGNGIQLINFIAGVATAGLVIVSIFTGMALSFIESWQKIAIRVLGSWIAAIGIMYLPYILMN